MLFPIKSQVAQKIHHQVLASALVLFVQTFMPDSVLAQISLLNQGSGAPNPLKGSAFANAPAALGVPSGFFPQVLTPNTPNIQLPLGHQNYDPTTAGVFDRRKRVMARWLGRPLWYAATVVHYHNGWYHLQYDDGDEEATTANLVKPLDIHIAQRSRVGVHAYHPAPLRSFKWGERVLVNYHVVHGGPNFNHLNNTSQPRYRATVLDGSGQWYHVRYDDGDEEVTHANVITPTSGD